MSREALQWLVQLKSSVTSGILAPVQTVGNYTVNCHLEEYRVAGICLLQKISQILSDHHIVVAATVAFLLSTILVKFFTSEMDDFTKRKKFILFNDALMQTISQKNLQKIVDEHKTNVLSHIDSDYRRVLKIRDRLLAANMDALKIPKRCKLWKLVVIKSPIINASALPDGSMIVYTGLLDQTSNDDQVALIMGHEIAHSLLHHAQESLSSCLFFSLSWVVPSIVAYTFLPEFFAFGMQHSTQYLSNILLTLPFSRMLEQEADVIGLQMAARACFDVREAVVFWGKMVETNHEEQAAWMAGHPDPAARMKELSANMPAALELYAEAACTRIPKESAQQAKYMAKASNLPRPIHI